jgi:2-aminoethylphosphonate-pyruvate transaminase
MKKLLFTPGPLSTSRTVKEAMMEDVGSRDLEFIQAVKEIRTKLLELAHVSQQQGYETVIMQGSGTFGIESVISSSIGKKDSLLLLVNGAYGERMRKMAAVHSLQHEILQFDENAIVTAEAAEHFLQTHPQITHLACVHSETTTGLFNPIEEIGAICKKRELVYIVDAMSSFGGVEMDINRMNIDFLVSSSNKCIEGVPGFSFVLCKKTALEKCKDQARTLSLDLFGQWMGLETIGQFRFTPPTLSLMAFRQAIKELEEEGGIPAREQRYKTNKTILDTGMAEMGFKHYLEATIQGHIITSFLYPDHSNFNFGRFYEKLSERGMVIYPGKLSKASAFRIGTIGQLFPADIKALIVAVREILEQEGVLSPVILKSW